MGTADTRKLNKRIMFNSPPPCVFFCGKKRICRAKYFSSPTHVCACGRSSACVCARGTVRLKGGAVYDTLSIPPLLARTMLSQTNFPSTLQRSSPVPPPSPLQEVWDKRTSHLPPPGHFMIATKSPKALSPHIVRREYFNTAPLGKPKKKGNIFSRI